MAHKTPHPTDVSVGQRIRIGRQIAGLTQTELGEAVDVKFQQIQKYETAANRVSASRLLDIANALGVTIEWLFVGDTPTRHGQETMPTDILYDMCAIRHLGVYAKLNPTQQQIVRTVAAEIARASE